MRRQEFTLIFTVMGSNHTCHKRLKIIKNDENSLSKSCAIYYYASNFNIFIVMVDFSKIVRVFFIFLMNVDSRIFVQRSFNGRLPLQNENDEGTFIEQWKKISVYMSLYTRCEEIKDTLI